MKVLVTGSSGFVGGAVIDELHKRGYEVLGFDRMRHTDEKPEHETFYGDLRDRDAVYDAMSHANAFLNLGGILGTQELVANPIPALEVNILGAAYVMEASCRYEIPGVQIAVGNAWMNNPYSISKTTAERLANMYREFRGAPISVVRGLNIYGPKQTIARPYGDSSVRKFLPSFVCRALAGDPIEVYGDGASVMDIIYKEDFANVFVSALESTISNGGSATKFEAGSGVETTVLQIAQKVIEVAGQGEIKHLPMRPGEDKHSVVLADTSTLAELKPFGVDPLNFIDYNEGIRRTVEYYREEWLPTWNRKYVALVK
jgi:UDP-glucose 4-epimerase